MEDTFLPHHTYTLQAGNVLFEDTVFSEENDFFVTCSSDECCDDFDGCTDDICTKEDGNNICSNSNKTGDICENCIFISFDINLDKYPEETNWKLIDFVTGDMIIDGKFLFFVINSQK